VVKNSNEIPKIALNGFVAAKVQEAVE